MQDYQSIEMLSNEIKKTAGSFIKELSNIQEADKDKLVEGVDRTPQQIFAYMSFIRGWDADELAGKEVVTPEPGYKWNQMGELYDGFYAQYSNYTLAQLQEMFISSVEQMIKCLSNFNEDEVFKPGGRQWAASTPSNWPIWKWVHINTVAPFQLFRGKIQKWKKVRADQ